MTHRTPMTNILFALGILAGVLSLILGFLGTAMSGLATILFAGSLILIILSLIGSDEKED